MSNDSKYTQEEPLYRHHGHHGHVPPHSGCQHPGHGYYADDGMRFPPPPPYYGHPGYAMYHGYHNPAMMPPPPPHWPQHHPEMQPQQEPQPSNPLVDQAQAMLEGALGEEVGMFKELLGTLGMNDQEFWKGAMIGAAAALLLSNENIRSKLPELLAGVGGMMNADASAAEQAAQPEGDVPAE